MSRLLPPPTITNMAKLSRPDPGHAHGSRYELQVQHQPPRTTPSGVMALNVFLMSFRDLRHFWRHRLEVIHE